MALIINSVAISNFSNEGVSTESILSLFSNLVKRCDEINVLESIDFSTYTQDTPDNLTASARTLWVDEYQLKCQCKAASDIASKQLNVFFLISKMFEYTENTTDSRQDVIDQLTSTLTGYSNTDALQFLSDIQG